MNKMTLDIVLTKELREVPMSKAVARNNAVIKAHSDYHDMRWQANQQSPSPMTFMDWYISVYEPIESKFFENYWEQHRGEYVR